MIRLSKMALFGVKLAIIFVFLLEYPLFVVLRNLYLNLFSAMKSNKSKY